MVVKPRSASRRLDDLPLDPNGAFGNLDGDLDVASQGWFHTRVTIYVGPA